jgi:hypothetical protein
MVLDRDAGRGLDAERTEFREGCRQGCCDDHRAFY